MRSLVPVLGCIGRSRRGIPDALTLHIHLRGRSGVAVGLALLLGGCGGGAVTMTGGATFTPTMSYQRSTRTTTPAQVVILFAGDQPAQRFLRAGSLTARRSGWVSQEYLFNAIRDAGAEHGLDGFMDVQCASPGGVGAECQGTGFVYR